MIKKKIIILIILHNYGMFSKKMLNSNYGIQLQLCSFLIGKKIIINNDNNSNTNNINNDSNDKK